ASRRRGSLNAPGAWARDTCGAGVTDTPFIAVIPARFASARLPGKPLLEVGGLPMVVQVVRRAAASGAQAVWVATDSEAVCAAVERHGGQAMLTSSAHATGTD